MATVCRQLGGGLEWTNPLQFKGQWRSTGQPIRTNMIGYVTTPLYSPLHGTDEVLGNKTQM